MGRPRRPKHRIPRSDEIRSAFALAAAEAHRLNRPYVGTEHVLMGIARLPDSRGAVMLGRLGKHPEDVVLETERLAVSDLSSEASAEDQPRSDPTRPVLTPGAMRAVDAAYAEVDTVGGVEIGSDFMIVGLLVEGRGIAAKVLGQLGITLDAARAYLDTGLAAPRSPTPPPARRERQPRVTKWRPAEDMDRQNSVPERAERVTASPSRSRAGFRMQVDDRSELSIYEQIIARVQEAIATGVLEPGDRLPPVRQLADNLDIAPGTVARAYSELEARGVVITEGARGTRIADQDRSGLSSDARRATLIELLRPVAVEAFHLGASATELHAALDVAARDIRPERGTA